MEIFKCLELENVKLGRFCPQVKMHKKKIDIRPLINSIRHPTEKQVFY